MLPHLGLYHVGLDGTAAALLVVIADAPPALLVQVGVGRLGAFWPFADARQSVSPHLSGETRKE